ncbi:putative Zn-dependent protease [Saccharothrix ecbatanensis]|uniref:Putative Zn-dependent protease n=1 Tax=Saccharothrix ecbatanensis TaxID=1105145 RepID=A0A7W9M1F5_9PSEU|nr:metallopeptidase TldD-related protein [Saccharothrix ecbatanensis]MBB5803920.1 putative Zn-dependent protease [Saccharothrix ecbatanensis]
MIAAHELVERALAAGRPGDQVVVIVDDTTHAHLRWAGDVTTSAAHVLDRQVHVAVITSGRTAGVVSVGGALDAAAVRDLVETASTVARRSDAVVGSLPPADHPAAPDWHEPAVTASPGVLDGLAGDLRGAARGFALHCYAEQEVRTTLLGTSTGVRRRHVQPSGLVELTARAGTSSAWVGVDVPDLSDLDPLLDGLERRLDWGRRRVDVPPGRYEVLLPPSCTADLLKHLYRSAGGRDAGEGRTAFSVPGGGTRLGDRVAALPLTLRSDPAYKGLECAPFVVARVSGADTSVADNGLALGPTNWITDGMLTALVHTRASAGGRPVTPRIGNLVLEGPAGGPSTLSEMIASTRHGLLLTSLWYLREVDTRALRLTGLTRDGVYVVRDGEVVGCSTDDFRFNESPLHLLDRVTEVGPTSVTLPREPDDERIRTSMPPLRVMDFSVVGARV